MLINEKEALARISSPMNLLNKMRNRAVASHANNKGMSLFIPSSTPSNLKDQPTPFSHPFNPFQKPAIESKTEVVVTAPLNLVPENSNSNLSLDSLLDGADSKIKLSHAHNKALDTLVNAVDMMQLKLDDIKPDKLPSVISAAAKVVDGIRRERNEAAKAHSGKAVHLHFYTPTPRQIEDYEIIEVN